MCAHADYREGFRVVSAAIRQRLRELFRHPPPGERPVSTRDPAAAEAPAFDGAALGRTHGVR